MRKLATGIFILLFSGGLLASQAQETRGTERLTSDDGLVSFSVPAAWYLTTSIEEDATTLIAAPNAERAANWQGAGAMIFYVYQDRLADGDGLLAKTRKDHALDGLALNETALAVAGLPAHRYSGQADELRAEVIMIPLPENQTWLRLVATASPSAWDEALFLNVLDSLVVLPQSGKTPQGWLATLRAPMGWEQKTFSSFVQWYAPPESPFAGMEVWFQAGFRGELVGTGDSVLLLRTLGVNYTGQLDTIGATLISGLPAQMIRFESFTHEGVIISAEGDSGTANLVARAPIGKWTPAHQGLTEAILASVRVIPPTADAAPVGLQMGYRPPPFGGQIDGQGAFELADFAGQVVFVHFWFVDCPICREEWGHLQAVYDDYKEQGMVLLAINGIDPPEYIASYQQSAGLRFPLVLDSSGALHELFGVTAFPSTFIVGTDGVLLRAARGALSERSLRNLLEQELGG